MKSGTTRLWGAAYHEAGHAVMAYILHRPISEVSIVSDKDTANCTAVSVADKHIHTEKPDRMWLDTTLEDIIRRKAERDVMFILAGRVAEEMYLGQRTQRIIVGTSFESHVAVNLLSFLAGGEELEVYLHWLWERTRTMLSWPPHWYAIEQLAEKLVKKRSVSGRQARATIRRAWLDSGVGNPQD